MAKDKVEDGSIDWEQESSGGELYKWEKPGQKITGVLSGRRVVNTRLGAMTVYDMLTAKGEVAVPGTKSLNEQMKRYPANGSFIVEIEFTKEVKGNYPNPFKQFTVRVASSTEARLKALGIKVFNDEAPATTEDSQTF